MSENKNTALRIAVAGGSIGGLFAAIALRAAGAECNIYERDPGPLDTRGAGIVAQPDVFHQLSAYGAPDLIVTSCRQRRHLSADGGDGMTQPMPQQFTSWEAIYRALRATFPDERYHLGSPVTEFEQQPDGVIARVNGADIACDLLVCADGSHSQARARLQPAAVAKYAGYIAWRGLLDEADCPPQLARFFHDTFTFSDALSGGHALAYFIPGAQADARVGRRRLNWVWYVPAEQGAELDELLTDKHGHQHHYSLAQCFASEPSVASLRARAAAELHPKMSELVALTPEPFIQTITDVVSERTVYGRACLVGDAAFVVRPHTAGATAKAAADAKFLADAIRERSNLDEALSQFQARQMRLGNDMHRYGLALASQWTPQRVRRAQL